MIAKNLVYQKSAKGSEAIATRRHGLSPKLRSLLILIDGKRDYQELARISNTLGDTEQLLGQLLDEGCIEPVPKAARAAAALAPKVAVPVPIHASASASAPAPAAAPASSVSLADARRHAVRRLIDIVGPNADEICMRIESARSVADFLAAVAQAEAMVRQFRGVNSAAEFAADMKAHQPS